MMAVSAGGIFGLAYFSYRPDDAPDRSITPAAAVEFAQREKVSGPVLNSYDFGGYLIFRGIPVFMDGRGLPFGKELTRDYFNAMDVSHGGERLDELASKYGVSWTLLSAKSAAASHFDRSPDWRQIYADDIAVIHVRRSRG
jgi:hypothetical protein